MPNISFNPRSPRGGATDCVNFLIALKYSFNPRSPRGGATLSDAIWRDQKRFQSTLPTRGSDIYTAIVEAAEAVSIHAPHEGERHNLQISGDGLTWVSIHAPHEGERRIKSFINLSANCFNPRSPRGGATALSASYVPSIGVSIHAPHEGERL